MANQAPIQILAEQIGLWERGYAGSVVQLRRAVARLRPPVREAFLRVHAFPADQAQVDWAHFGHVAVGRSGG